MAKFAPRASWTIDVQQEWIDVTSDRWEVDPSWRGTDAHGHEHFYDRGYPTLYLIVDASHWCDGHEGMYNHDPHEAIDESHYECKICRDVVTPGVLPPFTPQHIPGMRTGTLTGWVDEHEKRTVALTNEEITYLNVEPTDAVALAILRYAPRERIVRTEHSWGIDR